ncbi:hypothetical protein BR141012304_21030 [Brucella inopinata]|nr:hypothetical protein BR141012304_21030 [Brucella inopinata]
MILKLRLSTRRTVNIGLNFRDGQGRINPSVAILNFVDGCNTSMILAACRNFSEEWPRFIFTRISEETL